MLTVFAYLETDGGIPRGQVEDTTIDGHDEGDQRYDLKLISISMFERFNAESYIDEQGKETEED